MVAGSELVDSLYVTSRSLLEPVPAIPTLMPDMMGILGTFGIETITPGGIPGVTPEIGGKITPEMMPCAPVTGT